MLLISQIVFSQETPAEKFENVSLQQIHSDILDEDRTIFIYLPDNWENTSYPVFYILDGEYLNLYEEALIATQTNPYIIIGIKTDENRNRDMIPVKVESRKGSGEAAKFLEFLSIELQAYVIKNFNAKSKKILCGGSNAGLFTIYAMLTKPENFDAYISSSATIGYCSNFMTEKVNQFNPISKLDGKHLFIYYGMKDPSPRVIGHIESFSKLLSDHFSNNLMIEIKSLENEGHVPEGGIREGLNFIKNN
jgi:predicted alpha/beta superfamily hydrolase